ncbi:MAG: histone deacetylase [Flammeovirgaceae bacterium]|nr:histone deacetylase [Flammeovirgaceae bacterium]
MLKIAYSPVYSLPLPVGHRFPMIKYELLPEQLLYEGTVSNDNFFEPGPLPEKHILETHHSVYWNKLKSLNLSKSEIRRSGFPLTRALIDREIIIANGTLQCTEFALKYGAALNIAGGTHHAYTDKAEGFCLLNDISIAANYLINHKGFNRILVVDLDVHQGDGTAEIFHGNQKVFTFSMHGANNYPMFKQKSDLDIPLPNGTKDKKYLQILNETLPSIIQDFQPEFVFYQSGVDVLKTDKLGKLSLSINGCKERDKMVLELCQLNNLPVVVIMGGGYSEQITHIVEAHANTYRLAQEIFF